MSRTKSEIIDEVLMNDGEVAVTLRRLADVAYEVGAYNVKPKHMPLTDDEIAMAYRLIRELRAGIFAEVTTPSEEAEAV